MPGCSAPGCSNKTLCLRDRLQGKATYSVFAFPKDPHLAYQWAKFCGLETSLPKRPAICEVHFNPEDIIQPGILRRIRPGAIPCYPAGEIRPVFPQEPVLLQSRIAEDADKEQGEYRYSPPPAAVRPVPPVPLPPPVTVKMAHVPVKIAICRIRKSVKGQLDFWQILYDYYLKGQYCDLVLRFPGTSEIIRCHALVLASVSDVMARSLAGLARSDEEHIHLVFPGRSYSAVKGLLDFVYAFLATGRAPNCKLTQDGFDALAIRPDTLGQQSAPRIPAKRDASTNTEEHEEDMQRYLDYDDPWLEDGDYGTPPNKKAKVAVAEVEKEDGPLSASNLDEDWKTKLGVLKKPKIVIDCEKLDLLFKKDPELCQSILQNLREGKGVIRIDMHDGHMKLVDSYLRFVHREVSHRAIVGLKHTSSKEGRVAAEAVPLAWKLEPGEDPVHQFRRACRAFKAVFGLSDRDVGYQTAVYRKMEGEARRNYPKRMHYKIKGNLAKYTVDQLEAVLQRPDVVELTKRSEPNPLKCEPITGVSHIRLVDDIPPEELDSAAMLLTLDSGEVVSRYFKVDKDDVDESARNLIACLVYCWCDELGSQFKDRKNQDKLSPRCYQMKKSDEMLNDFYAMVDPCEHYKIATAFLKAENETERLALANKVRQCPKCGESISCSTVNEESHYWNHVRRHYYVDHKCDCDVEFTSYDEKKWHVMLHHPEGNRKYFQCQICPFVCSKSKIEAHMKRHYDTEEDAFGITHKCELCKLKLFSESGAHNHFSNVHAERVCCECNIAFIGNDRLNWHYEQKHPDSFFTQRIPRQRPSDTNCSLCAHCGKSFPNSKRMNDHLKRSHTELNCQHCGETFTGTVNLTEHYNLAHPGLERDTSNDADCTLCPHCGKSFQSNTRMKEHVTKTHTEYKCIHCRETFIGSVNMNEHYHIVHPDKPFPTRRLARRWGSLKIENGESPICQHCGKRFLKLSCLERHMLLKHTEGALKYKCDACWRAYLFESDLKRHFESVHVKAKNIICRVDGCDAGFNDAGSRYWHEKRKHKWHQEPVRRRAQN